MIIEKEKAIQPTAKDVANAEVVSFQKNTSSKKHVLILISLFISSFLLLLLIVFAIFSIYNYKQNSSIAKGIYINSVDVSGLSIEKAKEKVNDYYTNNILNNDIKLTHNDFETYISTEEIELKYDIDSAVNYAFQIGKNGNIIWNNYSVFNALLNGFNITPTYSINENKLEKFLYNLSSELPDAVVESSYYTENNNLIITKGSTGSIVNIQATEPLITDKLADLSFIGNNIEIITSSKEPTKINLDTIYNEIHKEPKDAYYTTDPYMVYPSENGLDFKISLDEAKSLLESSESECTIALKTLKPNVTTNMIGVEAFPNLLASFSTKYDTSNTNRTTNLRLAANKIDGYVLIPGETFSYNTVVGARTIAAGYKEAAVYENGEVVQGLGGGICQISTTLFNAALLSNLEIVELHNHQFVPSYVSAGRDATVVYGTKDFKFKNSRNYAIKITCSVSKGTATFNIYGIKEANEYDVNVYSKITSKSSSYIKSSTYRTLKSNGAVVDNQLIANYTYKKH